MEPRLSNHNLFSDAVEVLLGGHFRILNYSTLLLGETSWELNLEDGWTINGQNFCWLHEVPKNRIKKIKKTKNNFTFWKLYILEHLQSDKRST